MDAILAQIKVLSLERVHSACPIQSLPKEVKVMLFTRPPLPREASILNEEGVDCHSTKPAPPASKYFSSQPGPELPHKDTADHN